MNIQLIVLLVATLLYTYVRYAIFGNINPFEMPAYLLNKSIALMSVFSLCIGAVHYTKNNYTALRFWATTSLYCAYIHIILSLIIFSKATYPHFFEQNLLNLTGVTLIFFGTLAAYCFWSINNKRSAFFPQKLLQLLAVVFVGIHLVIIGSQSWFTPATWLGGLPPISLLSFALTTITFLCFIKVNQ